MQKKTLEERISDLEIRVQSLEIAAGFSVSEEEEEEEEEEKQIFFYDTKSTFKDYHSVYIDYTFAKGKESATNPFNESRIMMEHIFRNSKFEIKNTTTDANVIFVVYNTNADMKQFDLYCNTLMEKKTVCVLSINAVKNIDTDTGDISWHKFALTYPFFVFSLIVPIDNNNYTIFWEDAIVATPNAIDTLYTRTKVYIHDMDNLKQTLRMVSASTIDFVDQSRKSEYIMFFVHNNQSIDVFKKDYKELMTNNKKGLLIIADASLVIPEDINIPRFYLSSPNDVPGLRQIIKYIKNIND